MSAIRFPWVVNGLVPTTEDDLILKATPVITAVSGRLPVLKSKMARYCRSAASSPTRQVVAVESNVPPTPEVSDDSNTQPSLTATDLKVAETGTGPPVVNDHQVPASA